VSGVQEGVCSWIGENSASFSKYTSLVEAPRIAGNAFDATARQEQGTVFRWSLRRLGQRSQIGVIAAFDQTRQPPKRFDEHARGRLGIADL
jgi:hypothetical protein